MQSSLRPLRDAVAAQFIPLPHFVIVGRRHANLIVRKFVGWYHRCRPHQGLDNRPPAQTLPIAEWKQPKLNDVVCTSKLGGG